MSFFLIKSYLFTCSSLLLPKKVNTEEKIECVRIGDSSCFTENVFVLNSKHKDGVYRKNYKSFNQNLFHFYQINVYYCLIL